MDPAIVNAADTLLRIWTLEGLKLVPWFVAMICLVYLHARWTR